MIKNVEWIDMDLFKDDEQDEDYEDDEEQSYLDKERDDMYGKMMFSKIGKLIQTPLGPMVLDNSFHPLKELPVKMCHVNFPITKQIMLNLDKVAGLEFLKLVGRYRLLFVFGKLFDVDIVISDIEKIFGINQEDNYNIEKINISTFNPLVQDVIKQINDKITSKYWIAYIYPNRKFRLENLNSVEEVMNQYSEYEKLFNDSNGLILTSSNIMDK